MEQRCQRGPAREYKMLQTRRTYYVVQHFTTTSTGKLAFLNNVMTVFKSETDDVGNISNKEWQWK